MLENPLLQVEEPPKAVSAGPPGVLQNSLLQVEEPPKAVSAGPPGVLQNSLLQVEKNYRRQPIIPYR